MSGERGKVATRFVHAELRWVTRLRWIAGAVLLLFVVLQATVLDLYPRTAEMAAVAGAVLLFNLAVAGVDSRLHKPPRRVLIPFAWAHILFDLTVLTLLTIWTGGYDSPLLFLYVFHMVFASLLLPRSQAYVAALVAIVLFASGLLLIGDRPITRTDRLTTIGWMITLPVTVHLTNHLMRELLRSQRARAKQRRRLAAMRRRLAEQQERMLLHDRLVSIGQFAAGVAHEISNPLASMDGLLQLMERKPDQNRPDSIAMLREQVRRIQRTVKQLTTLAHPDLGMFEPTDVNPLVESTLETLAFDHRLRRVKVTSELGDAGQITAIPRALQQVLINLILNAVDAMEDTDNPELTLRTSRTNGECVIEVADNGPGIPPADRERIFKPFYTTKSAGSGTGLGLAISLGLVREHDGTLSVTASPSGGAAFIIRLPAARDPASEAEPAAVSG